jgi:hypothetical protein
MATDWLLARHLLLPPLRRPHRPRLPPAHPDLDVAAEVEGASWGPGGLGAPTVAGRRRSLLLLRLGRLCWSHVASCRETPVAR